MKTKMFVLVMVSVLMFKAGLGGLVSTNGVPTVSSRSGIVSVGPIVVTNGRSINFAADQSVLKVELTAEINKAKFELAEENRKWMHTIQDGIERMSKDAAADAKLRVAQEFSVLKSDVTKWYDELKDILDVRLNIFTWVIGILVALFGVVVPVVMEVLRGKDYGRLRTELREDMKNMQNEFAVEKKIIDDAKEKWQTKMADVAKTEAGFVVLQNKLEQSQREVEQNLHMLEGEMKSRKEDYDVLKRSLEQQQETLDSASDQRKREFEKLQKEMKERTNSARGLALIFSSINGWRAYKQQHMISTAATSIHSAMVAVSAFVRGHREDIDLLTTVIKHLHETIEYLKDAKHFEEVQKKLKDKVWSVTFDEVKKTLAGIKDYGSGIDYVGMFEKVYAAYGRSSH